MSVSYGRGAILSIKSAIIFLIRIFFKIYFGIFGRPKINPNFQKTLNLYKRRGFLADFSLIRFWDAPFERLERLVPKSGSVIDLGCGDGILSNYLATSSLQRRVLGIELNKNRLREADRGLKNTRFIQGDILKKNFPKSDTILLIHVFHHLPSYKDQERLLTKCRRSLRVGGKLIVTEIIETPILKFLFSALTDVVTVPILFEGKLFDTKIHYRTLGGWEKFLSGGGFKFKSESIHKGMPFSHVIFIAESF